MLVEEDYEERSFENLVYFYREELKEIINGSNASDIFPYDFRLRLRRKGILSLNYNEIVLSDKAIVTLVKLGELDVSKVVQSKEKGYIAIIVNL